MSPLDLLLALIVIAFVVGYFIGFRDRRALPSDGFTEEELNLAVEDAFRAGYRACQVAGETGPTLIDSDHVDAQRERGKERLQ